MYVENLHWKLPKMFKISIKSLIVTPRELPLNARMAEDVKLTSLLGSLYFQNVDGGILWLLWALIWPSTMAKCEIQLYIYDSKQLGMQASSSVVQTIFSAFRFSLFSSFLVSPTYNVFSCLSLPAPVVGPRNHFFSPVSMDFCEKRVMQVDPRAISSQ